MHDSDDAVVIQPLRDLARRPRVTPGGIDVSKHDEFEGLNRVQRQRVQQALDAHRPAKPKLRIKWGNVAAYISVLAIAAFLLWVLVDYTNGPTTHHHAVVVKPAATQSLAQQRCEREATAQQLSTDLCEGLPKADWSGWQRLSPTEIADTFPPGEHHSECWYWADNPTGATVCTDGAVEGS